MSTTIYVVTEGYYSDYSILGVYSTKEKAEQFAAKTRKYTDRHIEEYILDAGYDLAVKGWTVFQVPLRISDGHCPNNHIWNEGPTCTDVDANDAWGTPKAEFRRFHVASENSDDGKNRALKIASERLARYKAETPHIQS